MHHNIAAAVVVGVVLGVAAAVVVAVVVTVAAVVQCSSNSCSSSSSISGSSSSSNSSSSSKSSNSSSSTCNKRSTCSSRVDRRRRPRLTLQTNHKERFVVAFFKWASYHYQSSTFLSKVAGNHFAKSPKFKRKKLSTKKKQNN
ncbi:hypothetical protein ElyMa_000693100 [Elysia marginata]|uniref:REJ domain-containing protein n=1 Tax=Elysia marginata TaxID=1093978 RepID=A0AAV4GKT8_9GAST|nr:hypothetical protein ElyMa_000693100 [Elysia marginata]